ncbi:MAG TPA: hypothetical protein VK823_09205 [Streptosporangiaceae bacterium]|jgi:hypothetical protein|nr:hypothetical protein [Streptosporangiaceae bacterium]
MDMNYPAVTRSAFIAAAGAGTGWLVTADVAWATAATHRECEQSAGMCFGAVPAGLALGLILTIVASFATMAAAGARPLWFTVPAAFFALYLATGFFLRIHGGHGLHPAWAYCLTTAFALLVPGVVVWWPRVRSPR